MGLIFNATNEEQSVKVYGNWFSFKPKQIKNLRDDISRFISMTKTCMDQGLVSLPETFEDPDFKVSAEGKAELERLEEQGISAFINFHRAVIANNQVGLRRDLEQANIKSGPEAYASEGEIASMRIVAKYQKSRDDVAQKRIDEIKKLTSAIKE